MGKTVKAAIFVPRTGNTKTGRMAVTYASIDASCPSTCKLRDAGCYAQTGYVGITTDRLNASGGALRPRDVARQEARLIRESFKGGPIPWLDGAPRMLRLHVAGDARTNEAARILARAADDWLKRGGGMVYTYTHAWRTVDRSSWGPVSVLASVDNLSEAREALERGYAPASVVLEHTSDRAQRDASGVRWIPCPSQTRGVTCADCHLCAHADTLHNGKSGVAFAVHGAQKGKAKHRLEVV